MKRVAVVVGFVLLFVLVVVSAKVLLPVARGERNRRAMNRDRFAPTGAGGETP